MTSTVPTPALLTDCLARVTGAGQGNGRAFSTGPACTGMRVIAPPVTAVTHEDPGRLRSFMTRIRMGRLGQPEDLIGPLIFLASDMSRYVTGITLAVDGGFLAV